MDELKVPAEVAEDAAAFAADANLTAADPIDVGDSGTPDESA